MATLKRLYLNPNDPEIEMLKNEVKELELQIKDERESSVSFDGNDLSRKLVNLDRLKANLEFDTELYNAVLTAAEKNRVESSKQQRFLAVLSKPMKPEDPWQNWRHKGFLTSISILFVGIFLTKFILGMADSHRN